MEDKVEFVSSKCKRVRYSRTARRLVGYVKYRIGRSKAKPWIRIDLADFAKLAEINIRTARRCLDTIRNDVESDIVVRTCHQDRRWVLLCSTTSRLHGLSRSEPLPQQNNGKKRIVKTRKNGSTITQEQLVVGSDGVYWGDETSIQAEEETLVVSDNPNQQELPLDDEPPVDLSACWEMFLKPAKSSNRVSDISPRVVDRGFSDKSEKKTNTAQRAFGDGSHRLAFAIARNYIEPLHYDNCRIMFEIRMAIAYCKQALADGCRKHDIIRCYDDALHDCHAMSQDLDPYRQDGVWRASSTISRARKLLVGRGCLGRWKGFSAEKQMVKVFGPGNL